MQESTITIINRLGLHARAAGKLVNLYERVVDRDSSACAGVQPA